MVLEIFDLFKNSAANRKLLVIFIDPEIHSTRDFAYIVLEMRHGRIVGTLRQSLVVYGVITTQTTGLKRTQS
jgi:ABC-type dipeptide/oligopeptide/nickel transport system ATPase subunit